MQPTKQKLHSFAQYLWKTERVCEILFRKARITEGDDGRLDDLVGRTTRWFPPV